jgi:DNA polymerase I-like protein with 3'-5' exonuclease and polymerase domains
MIFSHDPQMDFYYYGEEQPTPGFFTKSMENCPIIIALDTETISLKERIAIGISLATSPTCCFYFPLFPVPSPATPWHILKDPKYVKVLHNAVFDFACLREYEIDTTNVRDTNILSRLLCYKFADLTSMGVVHEMIVQDAKLFLDEHGKKTMIECPTDDVALKCMKDSMATLQLYNRLILDPNYNEDYFLNEMKTISIMDTMSARGIRIDQEFRAMLEEMYESEVNYYEKLCEEVDGFKPSSSQQVAYILAKRGAYNVFHRLPHTKSKKRKRLSSSKEILAKMDDPMAMAILAYRSKAILLNDFIKPWAASERAYTRFHLDAATGRPSSTDRNMQNIPGEPNDPNPRNMFLPDSVIWTDWDFSQLELRCLAHMSGDREMEYIFSLDKLNKDGSLNREADIHQQTADFIGIPRKIAKNVNFAMVYGATAKTIAETANIRDTGRATKLMNMWFSKFPQAGDFIQSQQGMARQGNKIVETIFGRRIRLPDIEDFGLSHIESCAINYPVQGSAAEILKRSLIICRHLDIALQVHDQLVIDGYVEEQWLKDKVENQAGFYTPIEVSYKTEWS